MTEEELLAEAMEESAKLEEIENEKE